VDFWRIGKDEALAALGSQDAGLSQKEARGRLARDGPNEIERPDRKTGIRIFLSQFQNPLIYVLIGATAVAFFLGESTEATIILLILLVNAVLGFFQEYRSEKALEELRKYVSMTARVFRGGAVSEIGVGDLVKGDIVLVSIGDIVPADCRLLESRGLEANESVLTGESGPVPKDWKPLMLEKPQPHEMANTIFMGTTITAGSGKAVVVATARDTLFGKSAKDLKSADTETDFEKSIRSFGGMLLRVISLMTVLVFIINGLLGHGLLESFLFALAIAVGITPELLPIIITIGLSQGAVVLVKKHVAVRRLQAIEDLGNMDVLCADKTGTLTENVVSLIRYVDADGKDDEGILTYSLLCNSAVVSQGKVKGGTVDSAIWTYAISRYPLDKLKAYSQVDVLAFDYERKRMSVAVDGPEGRLLITKGAYGEVIPLCRKALCSGREIPMSRRIRALKRMSEDFGSQGYRVIAVAYKKPEVKSEYSVEDERGLVFMGFLILLDPPKKDAQPALERFKRLGVDIYVLTGDSAIVTEHICRQVGIANKSGFVLQGKDLLGMTEEELRATAEKNNVYARMAPSDKLAIVRALKANGHIVGFIGDGVNDASSLKASDVGISVSNGADIAKSAADVVLLRKSLNVVADGIAEGRRTFGNITKYIKSTTSANFGNMFTLTLASLFLPFIPLLPSQILLNNLLTDMPMLTISTDNVDKDELRKPRRWNIGQISRFMVFFGLISSVFDLITMGFIFFVLSAQATVFRTVWFVESALTEILVVFAIRTFKAFYRSRPSNLLIGASAAAVFIIAGLIYSPLAPFFRFESIPLPVLGIVAGIVFSYVIVVEIAKHLFFRAEAGRAAPGPKAGGKAA
jgi:Mg2+-importing ATPase